MFRHAFRSFHWNVQDNMHSTETGWFSGAPHVPATPCLSPSIAVPLPHTCTRTQCYNASCRRQAACG